MTEPGPPPTSQETCLNCQAPLVGLYCHVCGQSAERRRLDARQLLGNLLRQFYDVDSSFLKTFIGLWRRPGVVAREYVGGKRRSYAKPVSYFFVAILAAIVVEKLFASGSVETSSDPAFDDFFDRYSFHILLLLTFFWATGCRLVFRAAGYNLAENTVLGLFVFAQAMWIGNIIDPVFWVLRNAKWPAFFSEDMVSWVQLVLSACYAVWACKQFYGERLGVTVWKAAVALVFAALVSMVLIVVVGLIVDLVVDPVAT